MIKIRNLIVGAFWATSVLSVCSSSAWADDDDKEEKAGKVEGKAPAKEAAKAPAEGHDKSAEAGKKKEDESDSADEIPKHPVVKYTIDFSLEQLSKLDLNNGTYNADFVVDIACDREPCNPDLNVENGKLTAKAEKLVDEPLSKKFRLKAELDAFIDTSQFPYDDHELPIELYEKNDPFQVKLVPGKHEMGHRVRLGGWDLGDISTAVVGVDDGDGQKRDSYSASVVISRPVLTQTFKSLLPVAFMIMAGIVGLFLRPKSIGPRFAAAVGGLVPLVMFHVGQMNGLPPGGLTMFDKLMVATYASFFVHIIFATLILRSEEVKTEELSAKLYKLAGIVVPLFGISAWVVAFVVSRSGHLEALTKPTTRAKSSVGGTQIL